MKRIRLEKKSFLKAVIAFAVAIIFLIAGASVVASESGTVVSIQPATQTVNKGQAFTFPVYVEPSSDTPIMGIGFRTLSFDPNLVFVDSIAKGDIVDPETWLTFITGDIDNVNGEITNVYGFDVADVNNDPIPTIVNNGTSTIESVDKVWDLYARWESSSSAPTTVTVSWDPSEFSGCRYNSITLMRHNLFNDKWDFAADMLIEEEYAYIPWWFNEQWSTDHFHIRGVLENDPPYTPCNPNPKDSTIEVDINADLKWIGGDPNTDGSAWNVTLDFNEINGKSDYIVFGETPDANDGQPHDSYDVPKPPSPLYPPYLWAWFDDNLSVPYNLLWKDYRNCSDTATYDVYFGPSSPPPLIISRYPWTTYNPGTLDYNTRYYWKIVAWDNHDASTTGQIWSFTTKSSGDSGDPNGQPPIPPPENDPPIADADGPYVGVVGVPVTFDGLGSSDPGGDITNYTWYFGDGTAGYEERTNHTYTKVGNYIVTLSVTDNGGKKSSNLTYAVITSRANYPPSIPVVTGPTVGHENIIYNYTAVSTDLDNDTIRYLFDWGDGTNTTSDFLGSGTTYNATHTWINSGIYIITVHIEDENNALSGTVELMVSIDVCYCGSIGYLIDNDGDGIYDVFSCNETGEKTLVGQKDGCYLIDSDGDGYWDYVFDSATRMTTYPDEDGQKGTPSFELILVICAIAIIALHIMVSRNKRKWR